MHSVGLFEAIADRDPDRVAIVDGDHSIGYGALDERSNRLARYMIRAGMGPQSIACIHLPTGLDLVVAILASVKTGGAFLIVGPDLPVARKRMMMDESQPLVTVGDAGEDWLSGNDTILVDLDRDAPEIRAEDPTRPGSLIRPGSLAYLFYTSGSTGDPKAVMMPWLNQSPPVKTPPYPGEHDRHVLKSSSAFTLIIREIFQPLTSGGCLHLLPEGKQQDPDALLDTIIAHEITLMTVVPSMLRVVLANRKLPRCRSLRFIDCIGETLPPELRVEFQEKLPIPLGVTYGCTEAPSATSRVFGPEDRCALIDLGKPRPGRSIYILDEHLNQVPPGQPGQIYISGQLASGYFKRPKLTAERFIADPFSPDPDVLMYHTGDRGRFSDNGSLIYIGRGDDQVQINGQRVEPAEVEKCCLFPCCRRRGGDCSWPQWRKIVPRCLRCHGREAA
jgi:amino acid adenylation domain-containing protein